MSFTTITVTETFEPEQPGGTTSAGTVTFELSERIHDGSGNEIEPELITATLVSGVLSVQLYANDDPATVPLGSHYLVEFFVTGMEGKQPISIVVPHAAPGGTCTLSSLS